MMTDRGREVEEVRFGEHACSGERMRERMRERKTRTRNYSSQLKKASGKSRSIISIILAML
eukprot:scaffold27052_cov169-Skeletonema_menzelii.AAC.12